MIERPKEDLNNIKSNQQEMKHIVRAGLGFIGVLFALWGGNALMNSNSIGILAILIGIGVFYYGWKG